MSRHSNSRPLAPTSALDHALEALAANEPERALRWAVPALGDDDSRAPAADLVGRALVQLDRAEAAADAFDLAVKLLVQQGLAPHAVAAALALRDLTHDDAPVRAVAAAFGADAPAGPDVKPPGLKTATIEPLADKLAGEKLVAQAVAALAAAPRPKSAPVPHPRLPLWGALPTEAFVRFASVLSARAIGPSEVLMAEGEPGQSAFVLARGEVRITRRGQSEGEGEGNDEVLELAVLGAGAIVGEMALVTDAPRVATVAATRGALVLEAPRAALHEAAADVPAVGEQVVAFCHRRMVDNVLRTSSILREVPAGEREGLAQLFEARTFEPGEYVIREGESAAGLHLLAAGQVDVVRTEENGETLRIATLLPGTCVGEISLVLRRPATASVVAVKPSVSLMLGAKRFLEVVQERPNLLAQLYALAVKREDETLQVVGQQAVELDDTVLV